MKTNVANKIIALAIFAALASPLAASARPMSPPGPSARHPHETRYEPQRRPPQFRDHHRPRPHHPAAMRVHWAPPPPPVYYGGWYYAPPPPPPPPAYYYYPCNPGFSIRLSF